MVLPAIPALLAVAGPTLLKTIGLGALSGGAGFGVSALLKKITVSTIKHSRQGIQCGSDQNGL